jgi:microcystin-dependent protein
MENFKIVSGIDTTVSTNAFIPVGCLIMKALPPSALSSYSTSQSCIDSGVIPCDGRTLNASTSPEYQVLYNVIGNIYGGTSNVDFKVPDLRTSKRYVYGSNSASPSLSANTVNAITHNHSIAAITSQTLSTNAVAGNHTHSVSYDMATQSDGHGHYVAAYVAGTTTGGPFTGALTKSDGSGTAAGASHTHSHGGYLYEYNTSGPTANANHDHTGSGTSASYAEPTHSHTIPTTAPTYISSAVDIPHINMLYFIKM